MQDPVKVKLEREAGGGTDDNADDGADDDGAPDKEASPEASAEEDADGLGEPDTQVGGTGSGSESVEDADTGGKRKRGVEQHRDRDDENTGGKGEKDETSAGQNKRPHTDEGSN